MMRRNRSISFLPKKKEDRGLLAGVIGVMVFLSSLAGATGLYLGGVTRSISSQITNELSVQIVAADQDERRRQTEAVLELLNDTPGIMRAENLPVAELQALLEPWLGTGNVTSELPIPEMIVVELGTTGQLDISALEARISAIAPDSRVDDHQRWVARALSLVGSIRGVTLLAVILIGAATVAVVIFATKARLASHRDTLELVHIMGAEDGTIAAEFRRHFMRHGVRGALFGLALAISIIFLVAWYLPALGNLGRLAQVTGIQNFLWILLIPALAVLLTMLTAEMTVRRALRRML